MKPILFNTEMVRAILDGRKTVTRRVVKPQPEGVHTILDCDEDAHTFDLLCGNCGAGGIFADWSETIKAPYWHGDILYVRETWCKGKISGEKERYFYKADGSLEYPCNWSPSIHMPREAARIFLRVTDVRVERLQDIDDNGVVSEGLKIGAPFDELWDSTIKKSDLPIYGWDANPWVWVISFRRISKVEAQKGGEEANNE